MKMVAQAKLSQVQSRCMVAAPFTKGAEDFLTAFSTDGAESGEGKTQHLVIMITGDRGLCGSVNNKVIKAVMAMHNGMPANEQTILFGIGQKAQDGIKGDERELFARSYRDIGAVPVNFAQASLLAEDILSIPHDKASIVYTKYVNQLSQVPTSVSLPSKQFIEDNMSEMDEYEFDTDGEAGVLSLDDLYEFQLASLLHGYLLDTSTSEQAARVQAMDNSTKNANELVESLTLTYNKARQAKITGELIEIISGAEAV